MNGLIGCFFLSYNTGYTGLAALVALELANNLMRICKVEEAHNHYVRAAEIQKRYSLIEYVTTLQNAADCKLHVNDYSSALMHLTEICNVIDSIVTEDKNCLTYSLMQIRQAVEITRVFSMLLLKSSPMDMKSEHSKVMETYTWESHENNVVLSEDLFLLIQSVVMATQSRDGEVLSELENELVVHINHVQCDLLHRIVEEFNH